MTEEETLRSILTIWEEKKTGIKSGKYPPPVFSVDYIRKRLELLCSADVRFR